MALKITKDSKFILGKLTNGEEFVTHIKDHFIPCGYSKEHENLKEITIPEGITSICSEAFLDCSSLTTATFPASLKRIDFNAFFGCTSLQRIILPNTLDEVECWLDGRGVAKISMSNPTSDKLIENLKKGYAMDLYYKGEYRDDHWD